jgi:hypothetical protein
MPQSTNGSAMAYEQVTFQVEGFSEAEALAGMPDLLAELRARPWLHAPHVSWDAAQSSILIAITREQEDGDHDGQGTLDEVWDCVIATVTFSSPRISFRLVAIQPLLEPGGMINPTTS